MTNALHIIALYLHLFGIVLFVGPQFFLAFAWVPASRRIADQRVRVQTMAFLTRRFGWIGGAGLVLILLAGGFLIGGQTGGWRDYYAIPDEVSLLDYRYGLLFVIKMSILLLLLAVTAIHTFSVGPKLIAALERQAEGELVPDAEIRSARMRSMIFSMAGLVLVLVIMVFGVMMNSTRYAFVER